MDTSNTFKKVKKEAVIKQLLRPRANVKSKSNLIRQTYLF